MSDKAKVQEDISQTSVGKMRQIILNTGIHLEIILDTDIKWKTTKNGDMHQFL